MFNVILSAITLRLITNAPDNCFSDTTYLIKGENPIYHVGDTFERVIDVVYQEYIDYEDENGEFHSEIESETITDKLTDSLDGYTFTYAGQYTETLNGDAGTFRQIVNVYDYGDMNGDFSITVSDAVILQRIITEDQDVDCTFIENADTDRNQIIDLFDLRNILRAIEK